MAVIGDVGGHHDALLAALVDLGMDLGSGLLPADLTVVQVGDLVHRGPASDAVVDLVNSIMGRQPDQWVQLIGNHEQHYVSAPVFNWHETISAQAQAHLQRWWDTRVMRPAVAVVAGGQEWLVTHAGLTQGFWRALGSPTTAPAAARAINDLDRAVSSPLWRAGMMLGGRSTLSAGPVWASSAYEVLPGWTAPGAPALPFHQIHGHTSVAHWPTGVLRGSAHVRAATQVDVDSRQTVTTVANRQIIGVDPVHGTAPAPHWAPLVLHGARVA